MIPHSRPWIIQEDFDAVGEALNSGMIASGSMSRAFSAAVAEYTGFKNSLVCGSGTSALELLLRAMKIGPGDEVIVPVYVCRNVEYAVRNAGATVKYCDVSRNWIMTPELTATAVSKSTKAIILVHIFGIDASASGFHSLGLPVIHDMCQAFGLKPAFSLESEHGFCSFHATKCLTTGEGGAVVTNSDKLLQELNKLISERRCGDRLSDLSSSLGLSQLKRYPAMLERRLQIALRYQNELHRNLTGGEFHSAVKEGNLNTMWFRFPITAQHVSEEQIRKVENSSEVSLRRGVDTLLSNSIEEFPGGAHCYNHTLSLPIYPALTDVECTKVIETVNNYFGNE